MPSEWRGSPADCDHVRRRATGRHRPCSGGAGCRADDETPMFCPPAAGLSATEDVVGSHLGNVIESVHGVLASPLSWPPVYRMSTESARIRPVVERSARRREPYPDSATTARGKTRTAPASSPIRVPPVRGLRAATAPDRDNRIQLRRERRPDLILAFAHSKCTKRPERNLISRVVVSGRLQSGEPGSLVGMPSDRARIVMRHLVLHNSSTAACQRGLAASDPTRAGRP